MRCIKYISEYQSLRTMTSSDVDNTAGNNHYINTATSNQSTVTSDNTPDEGQSWPVSSPQSDYTTDTLVIQHVSTQQQSVSHPNHEDLSDSITFPLSTLVQDFSTTSATNLDERRKPHTIHSTVEPLWKHSFNFGNYLLI